MSFIGDEIKRTRLRHGLTSKQLAEATGLSQQFVGDVQHGRRVPTLETMLVFCNVFSDADPGRWAWLVIRDLYGDGMFDLLWKYRDAAARTATSEGEQG
jgi:transcriptional regulator with XRE-family HTH domain